MLASAAANDSGIPQAILDAKAEEVRKRKEVQDAITVSLFPVSFPYPVLLLHIQLHGIPREAILDAKAEQVQDAITVSSRSLLFPAVLPHTLSFFRSHQHHEMQRAHHFFGCSWHAACSLLKSTSFYQGDIQLQLPFSSTQTMTLGHSVAMPTGAAAAGAGKAGRGGESARRGGPQAAARGAGGRREVAQQPLGQGPR